MEQIDIIITWVDNSDEKWRKEKPGKVPVPEQTNSKLGYRLQ